MRVRTEARRREILEAALEVFRDVGYERASMAMISARLGGSKTTLYGYFPSKEELFNAAMVEALERQGQHALALLDPAAPDPRAALARFGEAYLSTVTSDHAIALTRAIVAEAVHQEAGAAHYEQSAKRILSAITAYLSHLCEKGVIRADDPHVAAIHFEGLLNGGVLVPLLFGAKPELKRREGVRAAVDAFFRAYAVERQGQD